MEIFFTKCSCYKLREKPICFLDIMATLCELPTNCFLHVMVRAGDRLACLSLAGSKQEFHENQSAVASDSMLRSLSFLLLMQRDFRQSPLLGIIGVQREDQMPFWESRDG